MPLFDAHCHYQDAWLTPHRARVFADLAAVGVRRAIVNGTCETDWPEVSALCAQQTATNATSPSPDPRPPAASASLNLASSGSQSSASDSQPSALSSSLSAPGSPLTLHPSFGLHPWDAGNRTANWQTALLAALAVHPHAALGEFGLDRWIIDRARPNDPRLAGLRRAPLAEQLEVFHWQLALAAARNLPASIHCLDAFGPLLDALATSALPARGFLLHAYSGSAELAKRFADLGAHFSFNGAFLDPRKSRLRELYAALPADRLLVETDAPAMRLPAALEKFAPLPTPDGSLAHHPANVAVTYAALAELRHVPLASLTAQVEENFSRLFGPSLSAPSATKLPSPHRP